MLSPFFLRGVGGAGKNFFADNLFLFLRNLYIFNVSKQVFQDEYFDNQFSISDIQFEMSFWTLIPCFLSVTPCLLFICSTLILGHPVYDLYVYLYSTERVTTRYLVCTTVLISGQIIKLGNQKYNFFNPHIFGTSCRRSNIQDFKYPRFKGNRKLNFLTHLKIVFPFYSK